eukprot:2752758-Pleurochrysis_carterae.AAC.1
MEERGGEWREDGGKREREGEREPGAEERCPPRHTAGRRTHVASRVCWRVFGLGVQSSRRRWVCRAWSAAAMPAGPEPMTATFLPERKCGGVALTQPSCCTHAEGERGGRGRGEAEKVDNARELMGKGDGVCE